MAGERSLRYFTSHVMASSLRSAVGAFCGSMWFFWSAALNALAAFAYVRAVCALRPSLTVSRYFARAESMLSITAIIRTTSALSRC